MLLLIDNYDSFTYNLAQYLGELGADVKVVRNDATTPDQIASWAPSHIVISPGPCTPDQAGISMAVVKQLAGRVPILGVCLGHQAIAQALGGHIVRAPVVMHGKLSKVFHDESGLFAGVANPFVATRYHSLVVAPESMPAALTVTAKTWSDEIMGIRARPAAVGPAPLVGLQFHPESIETRAGKTMLANFLATSAESGAGVGTESTPAKSPAAAAGH